MLSFKTTNYLSDDAKLIRQTVFVDEQKFEVEFDAVDNRAKHIVLYDDSKPIACCRLFEGEQAGEFVAGRIAVLKEYRGNHLGAKIMAEAERIAKELGGIKVSLSAQLRASGFYKTLGYSQSGEIYFDEYCEHIHMEKKLVEN